jgi:regulator of replication initiation timing
VNLSKPDDPAWILLIAVIIGPLLTYLVAARKLSGRIKDSDATELWAESRSIREWSTERVRELTKHIDELDVRLATLETKNGELLAENKKLLQEKAHLEQLLEQERAFNERLRWEAEHSPRRRQTDKHFENGEEDADARA